MPKLCTHCGTDCTDSKRFKDAQGHYTCSKCYDRLKYGLPIQKDAPVDQGAPIALADEVPIEGEQTPCPRCKHEIAAGETVCRNCRYDIAIGVAPPAPADQVSRPCGKCGYDMKGLALNANCPECGADKYTRDRARKEKTHNQFELFYKEPLIYAAAGLAALALIRLINGDMQKLVIDFLAIGGSVPLALVAYWVFSVVFAGGLDQGWTLAAVNFLAVFAVSWAVDTVFEYVPIPFFGWFISLLVYYGMLKDRLDLDGWLDALVLTIILRIIQFATIFCVAILISKLI